MENAVKSVKKAIKTALCMKGRRQYHITQIPSISQLRPPTSRPVTVVRTEKERQIAFAGDTNRQFQVRDRVPIRDYTARGEKWAEGK